eukprot:Sspe_Gene.40142::Locus_19367_Transcript_2_10_Confidence_0.273_Length_730::g.40142::m.40142
MHPTSFHLLPLTPLPLSISSGFCNTCSELFLPIPPPLSLSPPSSSLSLPIPGGHPGRGTLSPSLCSLPPPPNQIHSWSVLPLFRPPLALSCGLYHFTTYQQKRRFLLSLPPLSLSPSLSLYPHLPLCSCSLPLHLSNSSSLFSPTSTLLRWPSQSPSQYLAKGSAVHDGVITHHRPPSPPPLGPQLRKGREKKDNALFLPPPLSLSLSPPLS